MVPTQEALDAFRGVMAQELTAFAVALQGHIDALFRRQDAAERQLAALIRRLDGTGASEDKALGESLVKAARRRKAGPRQRRVGQ
jgi:hypothetical protein